LALDIKDALKPSADKLKVFHGRRRCLVNLRGVFNLSTGLEGELSATLEIEGGRWPLAALKEPQLGIGGGSIQLIQNREWPIGGCAIAKQ
jgi:hypothetical protein